MSELLEVRRSEYYSPSRRKSEFYSDSRNRHVWVASVFQGEKKIDIFCDGPMEATMYKFAPESVEKIEIGKIRFAGDFEQYGIKTDKDLERLTKRKDSNGMTSPILIYTTPKPENRTNS